MSYQRLPALAKTYYSIKMACTVVYLKAIRLIVNT